jgi:hypothetical protein
VTNRFVVQEFSWRESGRVISGWHVFDRETGNPAKGVEPLRKQADAWNLKNKMNDAIDKQKKKKK